MAAKKGTKKAAEKVVEVKATQTEEKAAETKALKKEEKAVKIEEEKVAKKAEKPAKIAIETKKDATKAIETKAGVMVESQPKKEEKKPEVKKVAAKKPAAKKAVSKTELKTEMFLQFSGKEYGEKDLLQKVKEVWTKGLKKKVGEMKEVKIYLKPEESAAYYVVNDDISGKLDL
ncbi:MAG: DNA-binding protein [Ruminococcus sp.]|nr:DNA-binding protein [Ruminococcus sp.]